MDVRVHDVSDVFRDRLVRGDPGCPARLCIASEGALHPVEELPQAYRLNNKTDAPARRIDKLGQPIGALVADCKETPKETL